MWRCGRFAVAAAALRMLLGVRTRGVLLERPTVTPLALAMTIVVGVAAVIVGFCLKRGLRPDKRINLLGILCLNYRIIQGLKACVALNGFGADVGPLSLGCRARCSVYPACAGMNGFGADVGPLSRGFRARCSSYPACADMNGFGADVGPLSRGCRARCSSNPLPPHPPPASLRWCSRMPLAAGRSQWGWADC